MNASGICEILIDFWKHETRYLKVFNHRSGIVTIKCHNFLGCKHADCVMRNTNEERNCWDIDPSLTPCTDTYEEPLTREDKKVFCKYCLYYEYVANNTKWRLVANILNNKPTLKLKMSTFYHKWWYYSGRHKPAVWSDSNTTHGRGGVTRAKVLALRAAVADAPRVVSPQAARLVPT